MRRFSDQWSAMIRCIECRKETHHLYHPVAELFKGVWLCCVCQSKNEYGDALSDVCKAAVRRLERTDGK